MAAKKKKSDNQRYLFFLRAYNDIDNIAPAVYFLLSKESAANAHIVIYSLDYAYRDNPNLKFLEDEFGGRLRIEWLGDRIGLHYDFLYKYGFWSKLYLIMNKARPGFRVSHMSLESNKFCGKTRQKIIDEILAEGPFPSAVIFDQNRMHAIGGLLKALRKGGVKKVSSFPVSPFVNRNAMRATEFVTLDSSIYDKHHDYSGLDTVVQCDPFYALGRWCWSWQASEAPWSS